MSRLVLAGYYANVVRPLAPIKEYLNSCGYEAVITDGESDEKSIPLKGSALKAGLGWIGKNSLLISQKYGSFLALGAILTDADISQNYPAIGNLCGGCSKCMDVCPGRAIELPQQLNRTKCLSHILDHFDFSIVPGTDTDGYFFECDICQNACPWNQKHIANPLDTPGGKLFDSDKLNHIMRL
jgi:epoxyqueuosine reductase